MQKSKRRYAAATLAAFTPLAAVSVITAAPSSAACGEGKIDFNGNCVAETCNKGSVRTDSGLCSSALSEALRKAQPPAISKVTPEQWANSYATLDSVRRLPGTLNDVNSVVNLAIDIPTSITGGVSDIGSTFYLLSQIGGGGSSLFSKSALSTAANVAQAVPSVGVPKVGVPKLSMPKLFQNCLPVKLVFFRPCI
ncbi:hypothetical protein HZU40_23415 [Mycolicibacterium fluoranthenivorans]|uniref:Uncharacterized protein n=1 Tax=Mycolicibacterium fluoranthenivorans TaxID=258505 RepID=A0A1G4X0C1_9MYCO|nr:hypothetical protein [Mycolicibacterium fluoranthenivorans]QNJ91148.1 hypothetical protein HZU40_23415 [Mycolicibacterium fluoranthenivorans]SCX33280.1 hypothetical protein SAMN02799620_05890 [Mycolicibacterium fluoranthenivorans]